MLFKVRFLVFWSMLMFGGVFTFAVSAQTLSEIQEAYHPDMSKGLIYICKKNLNLTLYSNSGAVLLSYPIACGRVMGPKEQRGDNRTPEGLFELQSVEEASSWGHDFGDGNGFIKNAYGPWFMRLRTGFSGIGIHGTHAPESIGTRATEGCIRVENCNLDNLHDFVQVGMAVIIGPENGRIYAGLGLELARKQEARIAREREERKAREQASKIQLRRDVPAFLKVDISRITPIRVDQPKVLHLAGIPRYIIFQ